MYTIKRVVKLWVKGFEKYDDLKMVDVMFETEDLNELLKAATKINYNLKLGDISDLISGESKRAHIKAYIRDSFYGDTNGFITVDFIVEVTE